MIKNVLSLAVPALLASVVSASAVTVDFTSDALVDIAGGFSGTAGSFTFELTGTPDDAVQANAVPPGALGLLNDVGLAGDFDGIGILNSEVDGDEVLTLTFDREVRITSAFFLNLFRAVDGSGDVEIASISNGNNTLEFVAQQDFEEFGGFGNFAASITGQTFTIFELGGNDDVGVSDFSLAGLNIESVPLPAGFLLLGTALGGLGVARRRKNAKAA